jgi:hypothetical protein
MATHEKGRENELEKGVLPHELHGLLEQDAEGKLGLRRRAGLDDSQSYKVSLWSSRFAFELPRLLSIGTDTPTE